MCEYSTILCRYTGASARAPSVNTDSHQKPQTKTFFNILRRLELGELEFVLAGSSVETIYKNIVVKCST